MAAAWVHSRRSTPVSYEHPGEVISDVRGELEQYGLDRTNWRRVSRLDPALVGKLRQGQSTSLHHTAAMLNAMSKYQLTDASDEQINATKQLLARLTGPWETPNARAMEQLSHLASLSLRGDIQWDSKEDEQETLDQLRDFARSRIRDANTKHLSLIHI